ncbi:hypothetical protein [Peteryoungia ipomoeae]|uniref:Uncharacterized protein n=1 Tax=Peteryoungia ipomoeae TaxID=1210932 RepID=A0A4S8P1H7_9HYPH|nr:hypothetical protein [Peteryoungia ipomoeae]THV23877.1 hypothetical protein FAA97_07800 [Peteryoungia ipomoeae]
MCSEGATEMDGSFAKIVPQGAAKEISFHEATVSAFVRRGPDIDLCLDDVLINRIMARVKLSVLSVSSILVDGQPNDCALRAAPDGEILVLELCEHSVAFVVEWNCFSRKISFTRSYQIKGEDVSITAI